MMRSLIVGTSLARLVFTENVETCGTDAALCKASDAASNELLGREHQLLQISKQAELSRAPGEFSNNEGRCDGMGDVKKQCSGNGCKVLATNMKHRTCNQYCSENGRRCVGAWEELDNTCGVLKDLQCDQTYQTTSDLLCECSAEKDVVLSDSCSGLTNVEQTCSTNGCKVLADKMTGRTCRQYCSEHNLACTGAWEEVNEDCNVKATLTCDDTYATSDLLCECAPPSRAAPLVPAPAPSSGKLVWSDEFEGGSLDMSKWSVVRGGGGFGNQERQFYRTSNARVGGGVLRIEAKCENYGGERFTSSKLQTKNKGDWGPGHRIEVRARLPQGKGTWPAVWMLPTDSAYGRWPRSGEIDIMEAVGCTRNKIYGTIHTEAYNHMIHTEKYGSLPLDVDGWHTYSIEWTENQLTWYVDGRQYHHFAPSSTSSDKWPFDREFFLILNLAVGGSWGGSCVGGSPSCSADDQFRQTQSMEVDYARVYAL